MKLITIDWKQLGFVNSDISHHVLDVIYSKIAVDDACIFVSPENLSWCLGLEEYKLYNFWHENPKIRVVADQNLTGDEWIVRTRYFQVYGEGA